MIGYPKQPSATEKIVGGMVIQDLRIYYRVIVIKIKKHKTDYQNNQQNLSLKYEYMKLQSLNI